MPVIAHLSDTHLDTSEPRARRAAAVMAYLNGLAKPVDAIVVTGDIADNGLAAEYEQARAILASPWCPVFCCPGNHDDRAAYRRVLLGADGDGDGADSPVNRMHRAAGVLFLLCDSTLPGRNEGLLADETLAWLDGVLSEHPGVPSFLCFHHPPVPLHSPVVDAIRQSGEHRLASLLARQPQVAAILCGHAHTPAATTFAGRPLLVGPGVFSTLNLPWQHGGIADEQAPLTVAFHILDGGHRVTTHIRVVPVG